MMPKRNLILCLIAFALLSGVSFAGTDTYTKYTGETQEDKSFAKNVYNLLHEHGVKAVEVSSSLMFVHVNEQMYRSLRTDTINGKKACRDLTRMLQGHAGQKPVNVYIYFDDTKVIETGYEAWEKRISVDFLD